MRPRLRVLLATPLVALLPLGNSLPTLSEPVGVALYQPDLNCGMSKFRMVECDPNEYVVQGLIGGNPPRSPGLQEREPLPVF
ncbi:MAG: hypothetical protein P1P84_19755 [Deferrisomatales bacterium]|nr:hypothetical protein [Deferrisomatales bacterium]